MSLIKQLLNEDKATKKKPAKKPDKKRTKVPAKSPDKKPAKSSHHTDGTDHEFTKDRPYMKKPKTPDYVAGNMWFDMVDSGSLAGTMEVTESSENVMKLRPLMKKLRQELDDVEFELNYAGDRLTYLEKNARTLKRRFNHKNPWDDKSLKRVIVAKEHLFLNAAEIEQYQQEISEINDQYNKTTKQYQQNIERQKEILDLLRTDKIKF